MRIGIERIEEIFYSFLKYKRRGASRIKDEANGASRW
jgi:hypothetical protein